MQICFILGPLDILSYFYDKELVLEIYSFQLG